MASTTFYEFFNEFVSDPHLSASFTFFGGKALVSFDTASSQVTDINEDDFLDNVLDYCIKHDVRIIFNDNSITLEKR